MSAPTKAGPAAVPAEEVKRRVAEYRRIGFQRQAPAHVVYHEGHHECPWAGCDLRIAGINFRLDLLGDAAQQSAWLAAWWTGPGLVARCPACGRHVLFSLDDKRAVSDPAAWEPAVLPDGWHQHAHVVTKPA
jgi:hypothetical protein